MARSAKWCELKKIDFLTYVEERLIFSHSWVLHIFAKEVQHHYVFLSFSITNTQEWWALQDHNESLLNLQVFNHKVPSKAYEAFTYYLWPWCHLNILYSLLLNAKRLWMWKPNFCEFRPNSVDGLKFKRIYY